MPETSGNPTNKAALTAKVTADNGADFDGLLQPVNQMAFVANASDLATAITLVNAIKAGLIAQGLMKAS